jgi:branched-chain amino acid aminotransferase
MHRFLLHNDEIRETGERIVSPGQVGLLNGWGVFSTIRVYDGVMFAWERHFARMQRDAELLRVPFPSTPERLKAGLTRLLDANHAANSTLRVVVVRNRGGMWEGPATSREFDVIAFTADVNQWSKGVRLGVVPQARHAANEFAGVKYLSWSQNLTWYERAHEQGLDEVVLLNERGEVSECTSANIFVVDGNRVWTPPLASGCLPGVTRALLLEEIRVPGLEIAEKTMVPADLEAAKEVFVTSTTRELKPVISIEGLAINRAEAVCGRMQEAFTDYVRGYIAARRTPEVLVR